jgi:hypothetical protein
MVPSDITRKHEELRNIKIQFKKLFAWIGKDYEIIIFAIKKYL